MADKTTNSIEDEPKEFHKPRTVRVRSWPLRVWVTPTERDKLQEAARLEGVSLSDFIRSKSLGDAIEVDGRTMRKFAKKTEADGAEEE